MQVNDLITPALRQHIQVALAKLDQVLPKQAPLPLFAFHNPLHGYQDLPFEQALAAAKTFTGGDGYLPEVKFRELYRQGQITDTDIYAVLQQDATLQAQEIVLAPPAITKAAVYRLAMLFDMAPVLPSELAWQIEELNTLEKFQPDIPAAVRQQFLGTDEGVAIEKDHIAALWQLILNRLELQQTYLHPENMLDLSLDQAEGLLAQHKASQKKVSLKKATMHERMREAVTKTFAMELARLGEDMSLRNLMMDLSGIDILDFVRPQIIRLCSSGLDEGLAPWQLPGRNTVGIYAAWRVVAGLDINPFLQELPDWQEIIAELPDNPEAAIILQLAHFGIPQTQWEGYLRCLALEIPGWAGMFNWREHHPEYTPLNDAKPTLADYLAIRLTLDRLWLNQICRDTWQIEATLDSLQNYFRKYSSEYLVRRYLFRGELPEYLVQQAEALALSAGKEQYNRNDWQNLADIVWTWQGSAMTNSRPMHSVYDSAWQLFRLCQHLGLSAQHLSAVNKVELESLLIALAEFNPARRSHIWLRAYERHYRENLLQTLHINYARKHWIKTESSLDAQFITGMDSHTESLRRLLETGCSSIETYGVAGFLSRVEPKVRSSHATGTESVSDSSKVYSPKYNLSQILGRLWRHSLRGNLLLSPLLMVIAAPFMFLDLLTKFFLPLKQQSIVSKLSESFNAIFKPNTLLTKAESVNAQVITPESIAELATLLQTIGLTKHFSPLVVFMGQVSSSVNNNYFAAYAFGIDALQQNGSSAAEIASLANRAEVRAQLAECGIIIPVDTWFIGAEYASGSESMAWYNLDALPVEAQLAAKKIQADCELAIQRLAQERTQQIASMASNPSTKQALRRLRMRAAGFSQVCTAYAFTGVTAAVIGRRALTRGLFLDPGVFLAAYEPTQDIKGDLLERLLLTVVPALTAMNLAYYFASVDNQRFGSGNTILHNAIGQLGVMEGASSDLRVGLPKQMTGQHTAMRLQLVVESKIELLEQLFTRQPHLQQLIHNGWLQLNMQDPETGVISIFGVDQQFSPWQPDGAVLPVSARVTEADAASDRPFKSAFFIAPAHG
ncbi:MAG: putative inorganic carbon transporter subunit DabA [Methylococcales bacterium]